MSVWHKHLTITSTLEFGEAVPLRVTYHPKNNVLMSPSRHCLSQFAEVGPSRVLKRAYAQLG